MKNKWERRVQWAIAIIALGGSVYLSILALREILGWPIWVQLLLLILLITLINEIRKN